MPDTFAPSSPLDALDSPSDGRKMGRPRTHKPTDETRRCVLALSKLGLGHADICVGLAEMFPEMKLVSVDTLRRRYKHELERGRINQLVRGGSSLMNAVDRGEAWAVLYLMQVKGGEEWRKPKPLPKPVEPEVDPVGMLMPNGGLGADGPIPLSVSGDPSAPSLPAALPSQEDAMRDYLALMRPKKDSVVAIVPALPAPSSQQ